MFTAHTRVGTRYLEVAGSLPWTSKFFCILTHSFLRGHHYLNRFLPAQVPPVGADGPGLVAQDPYVGLGIFSLFVGPAGDLGGGVQVVDKILFIKALSER